MKRGIAILVVLFSCLGSALGWNGKGHQVVAYIAYQHLTDTTRAKVDALLKLNPCYSQWTKAVSTLPAKDRGAAVFMLAATWPDKIKKSQFSPPYTCQPQPTFIFDGGTDASGKPSEDVPPNSPEARQNIGYTDNRRHKYWHFVDSAFSTDGTPTTPALHPNAVDQIILLKDALATDETDPLKSYDLVWLEHLVGDVHQPLHDVSRFTKNHPHGDAGGNLVATCTAPKCTDELHAYWDSILGSENLAAGITLGKKLNAEKEPDGTAVDDPTVWANEGFSLAKSAVYRAPISDDEPGSPVGVPDKAYHDAAVSLAQGQVLLGGYRLANLLNKALP